MQVHMLNQYAEREFISLVTVSSSEVNETASKGVLIADDDKKVPCQRGDSSSSVAVGVKTCYLKYADALTKGNELRARELLPCGALTLSTGANQSIEDVLVGDAGGVMALREGQCLLVLDGGSRVRSLFRAARQAGGEIVVTLPALLYHNLSMEEQAELFVNSNTVRPMGLVDIINGMLCAGMLNGAAEKLQSTIDRGLFPKEFMVAPKISRGDLGVPIGRLLATMAYGLINKTSPGDIAKSADMFSQEAFDTAARVMSVFHEVIGYESGRRNDTRYGFMSANVFQSVMLRIAFNHPFSDLLPENAENTLDEDDWKFFFKCLKSDSGDHWKLTQTMRYMKSSGSSGRNGIYDFFTAEPEKRGVAHNPYLDEYRKMFHIGPKQVFKVYPKFAAQNRPEMFVGGRDCSLWNPAGGKKHSIANCKKKKVKRTPMKGSKR